MSYTKKLTNSSNSVMFVCSQSSYRYTKEPYHITTHLSRSSGCPTTPGLGRLPGRGGICCCCMPPNLPEALRPPIPGLGGMFCICCWYALPGGPTRAPGFAGCPWGGWKGGFVNASSYVGGGAGSLFGLLVWMLLRRGGIAGGTSPGRGVRRFPGREFACDAITSSERRS